MAAGQKQGLTGYDIQTLNLPKTHWRASLALLRSSPIDHLSNYLFDSLR